MAFDLVPLRLRSNWAMMFNIFVRIDDVAALSDKDAESYLNQDILSIGELIYEPDAGWMVDREGWYLDVGWHDEGDRDGHYRLTAALGDAEATLESRSWATIQQALDTALTEAKKIRGVEHLMEAWAALKP